MNKGKYIWSLEDVSSEPTMRHIEHINIKLLGLGIHLETEDAEVWTINDVRVSNFQDQIKKNNSQSGFKYRFFSLELWEFSDNCFCTVHQGFMSKGISITCAWMEDNFSPPPRIIKLLSTNSNIAYTYIHTPYMHVLIISNLF
jgi:hypothetical protein